MPSTDVAAASGCRSVGDIYRFVNYCEQVILWIESSKSFHAFAGNETTQGDASSVPAAIGYAAIWLCVYLAIWLCW
jgi:hypothetical protein